MKQTLSPVRFTHSERRVVDGLRKKFFLINGVFYLCWLPNIINGIVLWTSWNNLPKTFIITVWYLMVSCSHFLFHPSSFSPCKYSYKSYFDILFFLFIFSYCLFCILSSNFQDCICIS